jgi:hypothetical protein
MYAALGVTTVLCVLIARGVFGMLAVDEAIGYGETAIAEAARPALGDASFTMMAIAALLATASSVNATLYASAGLTGIGLERPQPSRARGRDLLTALLLAHPRIDGDGDPGDEHAPVPLRAMALDAQRAHPRVPAG